MKKIRAERRILTKRIEIPKIIKATRKIPSENLLSEIGLVGIVNLE